MTKQEELSRREVAGKLEKALSFMRVSARTDYFTGYSLSETIKERIQKIGPGELSGPPTAYTDDQIKLTLLGRLSKFEEDMLSAISQAKGFE